MSLLVVQLCAAIGSYCVSLTRQVSIELVVGVGFVLQKLSEENRPLSVNELAEETITHQNSNFRLSFQYFFTEG